MAKKKTDSLAAKPSQQVESTLVAAAAPPEDLLEEPAPNLTQVSPALRIKGRPLMLALGTAAALILMLLLGFNLVYAGKIYPSITVNGVYLSGLNRTDAIERVNQQTQAFSGKVLAVKYDDVTLRVGAEQLGLIYNNEQAVDTALDYGRRGSLVTRLHQQARTLFSRPTNFAIFHYNHDKMALYLSQLQNTLNRAVVDASYSFKEGVSINPAQAGRRLDAGQLMLSISEQLSRTEESAITASVYDLPPLISNEDLAEAKSQVSTYVGGPLLLKANSREFVVNPDRIVTWIDLIKAPTRSFAETGRITDFYPPLSQVEVRLSDPKIATYVAEIAKKIDIPGQDAALTIQDGRAVVFQPSRDGHTLDQPSAAVAIKKGLASPASERSLALNIKITKPSVTEENINNLGIKELISEGVSFFPGSTAARIQNIRAGTSRYNGVLLKPDEVFSFGALLGEVGPQTGYAPARVIIGNRQEEQYGGGLCQVSSTAFRAALLAGLPIVQRVNHSFAVSYYTQPYGVPGVDATIYYPQVDFKFKNDSGAHILIQTIISGTTLKFQFYGTKTKEGVIRGPQFITGSSDDTKPSKTVFWRDIVVGGQVTKTDTFYTSYKASTDFPTSPQFN